MSPGCQNLTTSLWSVKIFQYLLKQTFVLFELIYQNPLIIVSIENMTI